MPSYRQDKPELHLALQGGGAHGAFTWGVLDRLLDEPRFEIGRISGTSAGALNGAALATGLARAGRQGAKDNLALLWRQVSEAGALMTLMNAPFKKPSLGVWDDAAPLLSPYHTSPMALETLRYVLTRVADVEVLRSAAAPRFFVNAVNVHTGVSRVFGPEDMSIEALMASSLRTADVPRRPNRRRVLLGRELCGATRCYGRCTTTPSAPTSSWSNWRR